MVKMISNYLVYVAAIISAILLIGGVGLVWFLWQQGRISRSLFIMISINISIPLLLIIGGSLLYIYNAQRESSERKIAIGRMYGN